MARNRLKTAPLRHARAIQKAQKRTLATSVLFLSLSRRVVARQREFRALSQLLLLDAATQHLQAATFFRAAAPEGSLMAEDYGVRALLAFWPKETWYSHLRFTYEEVRRLSSFFFPQTIVLPDRHGRVSAFDAMTVLLLRLCSEMTLYTSERLIGYEDYMQSTITRTAAHHLVDHWFPNIASPGWLDDAKRQEYAEAIFRKREDGSVTIIGFIDGTRRYIMRPIVDQRESYNGWLHGHTLLFIAVVFPDGSFLLRGPVSGRHNDLFALDQTGLLAELPTFTNGFFAGGDGIFPNSSTIQSTKMYLDGLCPAACAGRFSAVRVVIEWLFGEITMLFPYFEMRRLQKLNLSAPGLFYQAAAILAAAHNCLYPSNVCLYFGMQKPHLSSIFRHQF